jgi:hypothetical protein
LRQKNITELDTLTIPKHLPLRTLGLVKESSSGSLNSPISSIVYSSTIIMHYQFILHHIHPLTLFSLDVSSFNIQLTPNPLHPRHLTKPHPSIPFRLRIQPSTSHHATGKPSCSLQSTPIRRRQPRHHLFFTTIIYLPSPRKR